MWRGLRRFLVGSRGGGRSQRGARRGPCDPRPGCLTRRRPSRLRPTGGLPRRVSALARADRAAASAVVNAAWAAVRCADVVAVASVVVNVARAATSAAVKDRSMLRLANTYAFMVAEFPFVDAAPCATVEVGLPLANAAAGATIPTPRLKATTAVTRVIVDFMVTPFSWLYDQPTERYCAPTVMGFNTRREFS